MATDTMISKENALKLIQGSSKHSHMLLTATLMKTLAKELGEDEAMWELVGLLHDLDHDLVPEDCSQHGILASQMLRGKLPDDGLHAIKSHDYRSGFKPESKLDKSLIIADALAIVLDEMNEEDLSMEKLEAEIERVAITKPWLKENILTCDEIGLNKSALLTLAVKTLARKGI